MKTNNNKYENAAEKHVNGLELNRVERKHLRAVNSVRTYIDAEYSNALHLAQFEHTTEARNNAQERANALYRVLLAIDTCNYKDLNSIDIERLNALYELQNIGNEKLYQITSAYFDLKMLTA